MPLNEVTTTGNKPDMVYKPDMKNECQARRGCTMAEPERNEVSWQ